MRYTHFEIRNFKGIEKAKLDLCTQPRGRIFTLVGLNESGKTTILEAINSLGYKSETLDPLDLPGYAVADAHDLIPIARRSNFNSTISVEAGVQLDEVDNDELETYLWRTHSLRLVSPLQAISITQKYKFENSKLNTTATKYWWTLQVQVKGKGARTGKPLAGVAWQATVKYLSAQLPSILYFPNFLFEFPDRIYLEPTSEEPEKHEYYRGVLQDVLDSIGEKTTLETHVLARAKSAERADKQALESVLLKMGANLTTHIFANWNRIFKRTEGHKEIIVDHDQDGSGRWFVRLRIRDEGEIYSISERSLGFRWFFVFLLLTIYRGFRTRESRNVLFLLDEPASNLHPSAQTQLLRSFDKLPNNFALVYTTHSHHLINPDWLENTYVVANEGMSYGNEEEYTAKQTRVTLERYRSFASNHPNQATYFQPVLDVLQYSPTRLDNIPDVVMLEGKNDYYTLKYMQQLLGGVDDLNLLPGNGAGSLADVIRLYLAWGRNFIVLMDSDAEGSSQRNRYGQLFGDIVANRIFTLGDIDSTWRGKSLEKVMDKQERLRIQQLSYPDETTSSKTHFNRAIQELFLTRKTAALREETRAAFGHILRFCAEELAKQLA
jgi:energy-coupling factor transporter ATP-binding protein EcfA2